MLDRPPAPDFQVEHCDQAEKTPTGGQATTAPKRQQTHFYCYKEDLLTALQNCLPSVSLDSKSIEACWSNLKEAVYSASYGTLGKQIRMHKDWFDDNHVEIKKLLEV